MWGYSPQRIQKKFRLSPLLDQPLYDYGNSEVSHCIQRKRIEVRGTAFIEMAALLTLITLNSIRVL